MNTAANLFLVLGGMAVGLYLGERGGATIAGMWPWVAGAALLALLAPAPGREAARLRREDAYARWLSVFPPKTGVMPVSSESEDAGRLLCLYAADRVIKSVEQARRENWSDEALTRVVLEMRRDLGRPSLTLRPRDLESLISGRTLSNRDKSNQVPAQPVHV